VGKDIVTSFTRIVSKKDALYYKATISSLDLKKTLDRPESAVIQSYSNNYVKKASGLSVLFFKDLSGAAR
jgi:hypothetical protein